MRTPFEISRRADYATRMMLELGKHPEGIRLQVEQIVRNTNVPKAFLHKITADLVKAGLVKTYTGPTGGLALARPANTISLLNILEAIEGPICINMCQAHPHECPRDLNCPSHIFWDRLQVMIVQQLRIAMLDELEEEAKYIQKNSLKRNIQTLSVFAEI